MNLLITSPNQLQPGVFRGVGRCTRLFFLCGLTLVLSPSLFAQDDAPKNPQADTKPSDNSPSTDAAPDLHSLKFDGNDVDSLMAKLKAEFPSDNVVVAPAAKYIRIDAFEVRNVRLQELGKTIEFLSEGRLTVEVVPSEPGMTGNIWRIASKSVTGSAATANLKMRSVAAPKLFEHDELVQRIITEANELENFRLRNIEETAIVRGGDFSGVAKTEIKALSSQRVFVLVGNEDGISGLESFINAAEQRSVELAAEKRAQAASLAPKMRAVLAPHLFANEERLNQITKEFDIVQTQWSESHAKLMQIVGIDDGRGETRILPRAEQELFVLIGSEEGIAGIESLIQSAEKNAADEDAKQAEAQTAIDELKQQLAVARQKVEFEARMKAEWEDNVQAQLAGIDKELELRKENIKVPGPEWDKLVEESEAHINTLKKASGEEAARRNVQIEQSNLAILEIQERLTAAQSKAGPKE